MGHRVSVYRCLLGFYIIRFVPHVRLHCFRIMHLVFTFDHWLYCVFLIIIFNVRSQRLVCSSHEYLEFEC